MSRLPPEREIREDTPRVWRVVFLSRPLTHWWDVFSPPWCRHVLAYGYVLQSDRWLVVDPVQERTLLSVMTSEQVDDWLAGLMLHDPVIYRVNVGDGDTHASRVFQTCSSVIARVIGLKGSAWRPMALVRMLKAHKAEIIHGPDHERKGETA